jgi:hypothetical protein
MEIFLSWSGVRSKACAEALSNWLPKVINAVRPWISSADIDKGSRWGQEVASKLSSSQFGIVCLTPENLHSDWILFEAGALSKSLDGARTCTFLVDLAPSDVSFPLAQFQHTRATKDDLLELLRTINRCIPDNALSEQHLTEALEVWWPRLELQLAALPKDSFSPKQTRSDRAILEEMLELIREQGRRKATQQEWDWRDRRDDNLASFLLSLASKIGVEAQLRVRKTPTSVNYLITGTEGIGDLSFAFQRDMPYQMAKQLFRKAYLDSVIKGFEQKGLAERAAEVSKLLEEPQLYSEES